MKKVLITVSEGSLARNILRSGVLDHLLKRGDIRVSLLAPQDKVELYMKEFGSPSVDIVGVPKSSVSTFFDRVLVFLSRNCFWSETLATLQHTRFLAAGNRFSFVFKRALMIIFGRSALAHRLIRLLASLRKAAPVFLKKISEISPDLLFATDVMDDFDLHAIAAARSQGIPVAGMVRSWDNLTNGLMQSIPDVLLVWSNYISWRARTVQHIPESIIRIVGVPQYDAFFRKEGILPRQEFLSGLGINPESRIILFAAAGAFFMPYEWETPLIIQRAIDDGRLPKNCVIVARKHPNFEVPDEVVTREKKIIIDRPISYYTQGSMGQWEIGKIDIYHFANLMTHADVVVTGGSSITMDAALFDRPVINVAFDGYHKDVPYYSSGRRIYEQHTHYMALMKTHAMKIVWDEKELVLWIEKYLRDPSIHREERARLRKEFITHEDDKSAWRVARAIMDNLGA